MDVEDDHPEEGLIDLVQSASGIDFVAAESGISIAGVPVPFASPELLWRMKRTTHPEKDRLDLVFLRQVIEAGGGTVPD